MKLGDKVYRAYFNALREVEIQENKVVAMGRRVRLELRLPAFGDKLDVDFDAVCTTPEEALLVLHAREAVNLVACASALGDAKIRLDKVEAAQRIARVPEVAA